MTAFPLPLTELLGHYGSYMIYLLVGLAFGATLETAGFGNWDLGFIWDLSFGIYL